MTLFRRFRTAIAATGTGVVLVAGLATTAPANAAEVTPSAAAPVAKTLVRTPASASVHAPNAAVPTTCGVGMHRVSGGNVSFPGVTGEAFRQNAAWQLRIGGVVKQPIAFAQTGVSAANSNVVYYHAAFADGTLWRVTRVINTGATSAAKVATSPVWGAVKTMVAGSSGQLYVVFTSGTFARYRFGAGGVIAGGATIGAAGSWKFARSLGWMPGGTFQGARIDSILGLTESGNVNEYLIRLDNGKVSGFPIKTGWGAYAHVTAGGCDTGTGVPVYAVTKSGNGYLWFDSNGYNLSGADLRLVGAKGTGLTGLLTD